MDPLTLALMGGGTLASLFGGHKEQSLGDLQKMFGPEAIGMNAQKLFQILAASPAFRSQLASSNVAGQNLGQNINANLARSGIGGTGIGAVSSALGNSASGFNIQNLLGGLHSTALDQAGDLNKSLMNLWMSTRKSGPTPLQNLGGSVLGAVGSRLMRPIGGNNSGVSDFSDNSDVLKTDKLFRN